MAIWNDSRLGSLDPTPAIWGGTGIFAETWDLLRPGQNRPGWRYEPVSTIADLGDRQFTSFLSSDPTTLPVLGGYEFGLLGVPSSSVWAGLNQAWPLTQLPFSPWAGNPYGSSAQFRPGAAPPRPRGGQTGSPRFDYQPRDIEKGVDLGEAEGEKKAGEKRTPSSPKATMTAVAGVIGPKSGNYTIGINAPARKITIDLKPGKTGDLARMRAKVKDKFPGWEVN